MLFFQSYAIASILTEGKSEIEYTQGLQTIHARYTGVVPTCGIADFEYALCNAIIAVVRVKVLRCMFHYAEVVLHRNNERDNPVQHKKVKKFIAWAKLPEERMDRAFQLLKMKCASKFPNGEFDGFTNYFEHQWVKHKHRGSVCMYREPRRTNNSNEALNRNLQRPLKTPDANNLLDGIVVYTIVKRAKFSQPGKKRRPKSIKAEDDLWSSWDRLEAPDFTDDAIRKFLDENSNFEGQVPDEDDPDAEEEDSLTAISEGFNDDHHQALAHDIDTVSGIVVTQPAGEENHHCCQVFMMIPSHNKERRCLTKETTIIFPRKTEHSIVIHLFQGLSLALKFPEIFGG
ncbi:hypothetical protein QAD02_013746 [Eretmocerus hayati]|uniref:Uncharacterized protein n=1 Tax=Eretmocerus hayati TaxID=131215 RepID=A0ACC2P5X5_9HYME|nr:hypothetical protein QAD02_013746 [Eretmocerus hayati]